MLLERRCSALEAIDHHCASCWAQDVNVGSAALRLKSLRINEVSECRMRRVVHGVFVQVPTCSDVLKGWKVKWEQARALTLAIADARKAKSHVTPTDSLN